MGPSRHKSIARYTDITFEGISTGDYVSLCVFLISSDSRTGKWDRILPNYRFTISDEFTWSNEVYQGKMRSYCKTLPESPTSAPSSMPSLPPPDISYSFPAVDSFLFVHGICVLGASYAEATSNYSRLSYTLVSNFQSGTKLWDDRNYAAEGIQGSEMCQGGLYLRPSRHKSIARNTEIVFEGNSIAGENVSLCVFLMSNDSRRTGNWDNILPSDGFTISEEFTWIGGGRMRSYC